MRDRFVVLAVMLALAAPAIAAETAAPTPNPAAAAVEKHIMVRPDGLTWAACSPALPPGAQCATIEGDVAVPDRLFTYRVKLPDGYRIAPHFHPADEHLTVISGTFMMGLGKTVTESALAPMPPGSFMVMPKGEAHYAKARGETVVQVHGIGPWGLTYVNASDDPRTKR